MFTILDNLVDGLCGWAETFRDHRRCVNFCAAFALIAIGVGAGILHTTQVYNTSLLLHKCKYHRVLTGLY